MNPELKIYSMDCGWQGSILVIARNYEEAKKLMEPMANYSNKRTIEEQEIQEGFIHCNTGDL